MSLGVGGATTYSMASNHQTALNHNFRPTEAHDPNKQVRVKCTFCGCWATKGKDCPQCKRPTAAVVAKRSNNQKVETLADIRRKSSVTSTTTPAGTAPPAPSAEKRPSISNPSSSTGDDANTTASPSAGGGAAPDDAHNALQHKFRDEVAYDHTKQTKIKCTKCGCWAKKGIPCSLCKTVTNK